MPVAEHHDGFALYDCAYSTWNAATMGPKRDLIGDLAEAVRRQWLVFGLSSHRAEHWWFFNGGMAFDADVQDARYADLYGPAQSESLPPNEAFLDDWLARTCELVDKYRPQLVWFDWWIEQPIFQPYLQRFAAYYYNRGADWQRGVTINYKHDAYPEGTAVFDVERGQLDDIRPRFWQTDTAVAKKKSMVDPKVKTPKEGCLRWRPLLSLARRRRVDRRRGGRVSGVARSRPRPESDSPGPGGGAGGSKKMDVAVRSGSSASHPWISSHAPANGSSRVR